jgi:hypothetical protein
MCSYQITHIHVFISEYTYMCSYQSTHTCVCIRLPVYILRDTFIYTCIYAFLTTGQELVTAFFNLNSNFNSSAQGAQLNGLEYNGGTRRTAAAAAAADSNATAVAETPAANVTDTSTNSSSNASNSSSDSSSSSSSGAKTLGVVQWHTGDFELDRLYANFLACPR